MQPEAIDAILQNLGRSHDGKSWWGNFVFDGRTDLELEILDVEGLPCRTRVEHARLCLSKLTALARAMETALTAAAAHPLFPPPEKRKWWFEALWFSGEDAKKGQGVFVVDERGYEYIYMRYIVHLERGEAVGVSAENC
jgi:hypothetical protein